MSKTVFILGAGASKKSGAPLMNDFLDVSRFSIECHGDNVPLTIHRR